MMGKHAPPSIGRRRDSRLRIAIPATLITVAGQWRATLCDISQSGARLRIGEQIRDDQEAVLSWLEFESFGKIVWCHDGYVGLEFYDLLAPNVLIVSRDRMDLGDVVTDEQKVLERSKAWYQGRPTSIC